MQAKTKGNLGITDKVKIPRRWTTYWVYITYSYIFYVLQIRVEHWIWESLVSRRETCGGCTMIITDYVVWFYYEYVITPFACFPNKIII